ncbi:MAG: Ig-like domain-containing protein, partial [Acutalibacteraceae bacterium]|nr:Ig-like domain-containing protein [Acutalibacteraceae bacterium]
MKTAFKRIASSVCAVALATSMLVSTTTVSASALTYDGSSSYESGKYYKNLTKVTLTGDQRKDIVNVAKSQVGYLEGNSTAYLSGQTAGSANYTEYGRWYGTQDMWCAMFVSWCANTAKISTSIVPKHSYTVAGLDEFIKKGQAYSRSQIASGKYTPQAGDIIYFKSSRNNNKTNHVGIVTKYANNKVYTIEGNDSNAVKTESYSITDTYIVYICKPAYKTAKSSVSLNKTSLSLYDGKSETLKATVTGSSKVSSWTSSDKKIATVSSGKVTAIAPGTATITVKLDNGKTAKCTVTVKKSTVKLNKTSLSLYEGKAETLTATVTGGSKVASWTSSNKKIATVSSGKVTAVAPGTATITVKLANGNTAKCTVTVKKSTVKLDKTSVSLYEGQTATPKATVTGTSKIASWTSSNTKVATVTSAGKITAVAPGTATVTVKLANGSTAKCTVTVKKSTVKLDKTTLSLEKGKTATLK